MVDRNKRTANSHPRAWAAALLVAVVSIPVGCSPPAQNEPSGPSYAELVVTYNAELQALDRLEAKRMGLVKQIATVGKVTDASALEALNAILGSAQAVGAEAGAVPSDPQKVLDQAVEQAEAAAKTLQDLSDAVTDKSSGGPLSNEPLSPEDEAARNKLMDELQELEKEIDAQKQRVVRAREARDAAEAE